jgi:hypothetical protein
LTSPSKHFLIIYGNYCNVIYRSGSHSVRHPCYGNADGHPVLLHQQKMRIKISQIPAYRDKYIIDQKGKCWLCEIDLNKVTPCLDHDHETGFLRGVLCQNCNGIEGKIHNLTRRAKRDKTKMEFLDKVMSYWSLFNAHPRTEIHPTHKTPDEKRLRRNKKARERRKKT